MHGATPIAGKDPNRTDRRKLWVYIQPSAWPFWAIHAAAIAGVIRVGFSWTGVLTSLAVYYVGMFFITGGYHRYFSHRAYKTSRLFQFILALGGTCTSQKGVLWWAATHRYHHKYSDGEQDVHSPLRHGILWAHIGWILDTRFEGTQWDRIPDMAKYPELRFLNKFWLLPPAALGLTLWAVGGTWLLVWGSLVATTMLWHGTFTINSLSHVFGSRRYNTTDTSRNNPILALVTLGEGWHNNHHFYQRSANQGFRWYEFDITYYVLRILATLGVVWDVHKAPRHIVENRTKHPKHAATAGTSPGSARPLPPCDSVSLPGGT